MKCNRNKLAEIFGVDLTTVDRWKRRGCPFVKEGRDLTFDTKEVLAWWFDDKMRRESWRFFR